MIEYHLSFHYKVAKLPVVKPAVTMAMAKHRIQEDSTTIVVPQALVPVLATRPEFSNCKIP